MVCHDKLPLELRRSINATIAAQAYAYVGEAAVYAMVVWLQENMPTILAERGIVDAEPEACRWMTSTTKPTRSCSLVAVHT